MPLDETAPVALITGGAKRVGLAVTQRLANAGHAVVVHANRSTDAAQALADTLTAGGGAAMAQAADLTDESAVAQLVRAAADWRGRLDVVVHCAAIWDPKPLEQTTGTDVLKNLQVNALAPFFIAQQAGLRMCPQQHGGAIVLFGDAACERPQRDYAAYHLSKGGIPTLTRAMAVELAHRNPAVRVNAVLPGPVLASPNEPDERQRHVRQGVLVGETGDASHLADAVMHLVGNRFVTGVCLPVEGGRRLARGWS